MRLNKNPTWSPGKTPRRWVLMDENGRPGLYLKLRRSTIMKIELVAKRHGESTGVAAHRVLAVGLGHMAATLNEEKP